LYEDDSPSDRSDDQHADDDEEFVYSATNAASVKRTKKCSLHLPSDTNGLSKNDDRMPLAEDDLCALCGQAWVTPEAHCTYLNLKTSNCVEGGGYKAQLKQKQKQRMHVDDIMVLCDGCNGSYHLICVGKI